MPLAQAAEEHAELVERHLGSVVAGDTPFVARNDAHWTDGTFVYVPRGVTVDEPIVITTAHEQAGTALHWRLLVVLEEDAQASVWHESSSAADGLVNGVVELVVGQNARLRLVDLQDLEETTWVFGTQRATVGRDASLDWITLGFGSANGKVFQETQLAGAGAHGSVTGAYATRGRQHIDFDTLQEHAAPDTTSDLAFRGILADRSSAVWRGMIQVDKGASAQADRSSAVWRGMIKVDPARSARDAFQESRNLLLSKRAPRRRDPGPRDPGRRRALHPRGGHRADRPRPALLPALARPARGGAQRLVIEGFLQALVERLEAGPVREAVGAALERRLAAVLGALACAPSPEPFKACTTRADHRGRGACRPPRRRRLVPRAPAPRRPPPRPGPRAVPGMTPLPSVPSVAGLPLAPELPAPAAPAGAAVLGVPGPDRLRVQLGAGRDARRARGRRSPHRRAWGPIGSTAAPAPTCCAARAATTSSWATPATTASRAATAATASTAASATTGSPAAPATTSSTAARRPTPSPAATATTSSTPAPAPTRSTPARATT